MTVSKKGKRAAKLLGLSDRQGQSFVNEAKKTIARCKKPMFHLRLVISEEEIDYCGYDLDNAKPWPLGSYTTEDEAIRRRNGMVLLDK